jgi:capsular exopolysaccharide synthesis family protein
MKKDLQSLNSLNSDENLDLKELYHKLRFYWKPILFSVIICVCIAFVYNRFTESLFEANASILIKKEKSLLDLDITSPLSAFDNQNYLKNEIEILKSPKITLRALSRLNFGIAYFERIAFVNYELYNNCPFSIIPDSSHLQITDIPFTIKFESDSTFTLEVESKSATMCDVRSQNIVQSEINIIFKKTYSFHDTVEHSYFRFVLKHNPNNLSDIASRVFKFIMRTQESLLADYRQFKVEDSKYSSVIKISIVGRNVDKTVDFLNALCNAYLEKSVEKKLLSAENTIKFIESQIVDVSDSLRYSEEKLQSFQSTNKVMDIDFHSQQLFNTLEQLQNKKAEQTVKYKYYIYLKEYLGKNTDGRDFVAPSSIGVNDEVLNKLLGELIVTLSERAELAYNVKKDNPVLASYDGRIENTKKTILESVDNMLSAINIEIKETDKRINELSEKAGKLPKTQRELFGFERVFKLNDALYTFLLTKRSETQIAKAALLPDNELVSEAHKRDAILVSPKTLRNLIFGFLIGFIIPILFIYLSDFFNDKIRSNEDIEKIVDFPFLGHILHQDTSDPVPVITHANSLIAESFRSLRANYKFIAPIEEKQTILVTSSMMNEGKSFTSLNLAASFALFGKKVVLVCFDLRKPMLKPPFDIQNKNGLSHFLSGYCALEDIINDSIHENLKVIIPGQVPPNPNELIASEKTTQLFNSLKQQFDLIVIDTPPIGMVADALLLVQFSTQNFFVVRHNFTRFGVFKGVSSALSKRKITNVNVVINDLPLRSSSYGSGYGYGYNYNYGYAYGYYHKEEQSNWKKFFNYFKSSTKA